MSPRKSGALSGPFNWPAAAASNAPPAIGTVPKASPARPDIRPPPPLLHQHRTHQTTTLTAAASTTVTRWGARRARIRDARRWRRPERRAGRLAAAADADVATADIGAGGSVGTRWRRGRDVFRRWRSILGGWRHVFRRRWGVDGSGARVAACADINVLAASTGAHVCPTGRGCLDRGESRGYGH